jgi:hypothetical protein
MGATARAQVRSDAVILTGPLPLTSTNTRYQVSRSAMLSVVVLAVAGSLARTVKCTAETLAVAAVRTPPMIDAAMRTESYISAVGWIRRLGPLL